MELMPAVPSEMQHMPSFLSAGSGGILQQNLSGCSSPDIITDISSWAAMGASSGPPAFDVQSTGSNGDNDAGSVLIKLIALATEHVSDALSLDSDTDLENLGLDSISQIDFMQDVNQQFGVSLNPSAMFELCTLSQLRGRIVELMVIPTTVAPMRRVSSMPTFAPASITGGERTPSAAQQGGGDEMHAIMQYKHAARRRWRADRCSEAGTSFLYAVSVMLVFVTPGLPAIVVFNALGCSEPYNMFILAVPLIGLVYFSGVLFIGVLLHWLCGDTGLEKTVQSGPWMKFRGFQDTAKIFFSPKWPCPLLHFMTGTVMMSAYMRLHGSKVGKRSVINTTNISPGRLLSIGDDVVLEHQCVVNTSDADVDHSAKIHRRVHISDRSVVGPFAEVRPGTFIGRDCVIHPKAMAQGIVDDRHAVLHTAVRKRVGLTTFRDPKKPDKCHRDDFQSTFQLRDGYPPSLVAMQVLLMTMYTMLCAAAMLGAVATVEPLHNALANQTWVPALPGANIENIVDRVTGSAVFPQSSPSGPISFCLILTMPLTYIVFTLFMAIAAVLLKWLLIGRSRGTVALTPFYTAKHWFMQKLCSSVEATFVNYFCISTIGMNCFLLVMGAKCSWTARISDIDGPGGPTYDLLEFGKYVFSAGGPMILRGKVLPYSDPPVVKWHSSTFGDHAFLGHWAVLMQGAGLQPHSGSVDLCVIPPGHQVQTGKSFVGYGIKPYGACIKYNFDAGEPDPPTTLLAGHFAAVCLLTLWGNLWFWTSFGFWVLAVLCAIDYGPTTQLTGLFPLQVDLVLYIMALICCLVGSVGVWLILYMLSVVVHKWLLIGRIKDNQGYDPYGFKMVAWLGVFRMQMMNIPLFSLFRDAGPLMEMYYRINGAKLGKNFRAVGTGMHCPDFDNMDFGDDVVAGAICYAHNFSNGKMKFNTVRLGKGTVVWGRSVIMPGVSTDPYTVVGTSSVVMGNTHLENEITFRINGITQYYNKFWLGVPARPCSPQPQPGMFGTSVWRLHSDGLKLPPPTGSTILFGRSTGRSIGACFAACCRKCRVVSLQLPRFRLVCTFISVSPIFSPTAYWISDSDSDSSDTMSDTCASWAQH